MKDKKGVFDNDNNIDFRVLMVGIKETKLFDVQVIILKIQNVTNKKLDIRHVCKSSKPKGHWFTHLINVSWI